MKLVIDSRDFVVFNYKDVLYDIIWIFNDDVNIFYCLIGN